MNKVSVITSRANQLVKYWSSINSNKASEYILIEGIHLIKMAAEVTNIISLLFVEGSNNIKADNYYQITKEIGDKLTTYQTSQNIFAVVKKQVVRPDLTKHLLYLDNVSDPGNMGTLIRTALAFNFGGVICSTNSVSFYHPRVITSGQGAHFKIPLLVSDDLSTYKKNGYTIVGTSLIEASDIDNYQFNNKTLIILGNEARGISREKLSMCDQKLKISINNIDSLNVSIAGAIIMYLASKK